MPSDSLSRLQASTELLPRLIARLDDTNDRWATQTLFALTPERAARV